MFKSEKDFENALISALQNKGWERKVLKNPTEEDLINNWAQILFENNKSIDRLNNVPLTESEMNQILDQIKYLRTPVKLNGFINGKTVTIKRDNKKDVNHYGKEISLKIYDRHEIAAGQSRYQIAQQPVFRTKSEMLNNRQGDLMLLINGMPVIHIELKRSGVSVDQACNQIEKYSYEGVYTGIFSLVQIFVAMNPEKTLYFANPGSDGVFNRDFYFHWADFNNEPINDWNDIATYLLSIPMAHQLIGFYTVADDLDGVLKVMRSYQYYAANAISDKVSKIKWDEKHLLGGYIWHTTGSGKTMTSFKSAQLIANSKDADKVVFLVDRIELGTQSLDEYRSFAEDNEDVQATENTYSLISKLKSNKPSDMLIVTSIQKMSNIKEEEGVNESDIEIMNSKRVVFIVDEAHRSTFGDMLITIKNTFSNAVFFGFTGTPIRDNYMINKNTTATVFGNELHRYSIADGIRDKNVLGFDPYKVETYDSIDLRREVALDQANAKTEEEAISDPKKAKVYYKFMNEVDMAGFYDKDGKYVKGIEDYIKKGQYNRDDHRNMVVKDILDNWIRLSRNSKFHSIFATSSISEAIQYYRLFKSKNTNLKITALFDPNIDNKGNYKFKEDGLIEILNDYNRIYTQTFNFASHAKFKKDVASRLAHKKPYERIEKEKDKQLDILIVVDQMLTGFDSKWVNTLYLDKLMNNHNIIQAFSRTNRLYGVEKPFGTIRYYRYPYTMERNVKDAVKKYSGDRPLDLFVEHLDYNLKKMNEVFEDISKLFKNAGINNYEKLPDDVSVRKEFAKLFSILFAHVEASRIQGFTWDKKVYSFDNTNEIIELVFDELTYNTLFERYKELKNSGDTGIGDSDDVGYDIDGRLIQTRTDTIDYDYMNSRFEKFLKVINKTNMTESEFNEVLDELHRSFAWLSQEEQKYANIFIHDVRNGEIELEKGKSFRDYITEYQIAHTDSQIKDLVSKFDLEENELKKMMKLNLNDSNLNEFGRFDRLLKTVSKEKAKKYFEDKTGKPISTFKLNRDISKLLKEFIISGGFDL